LGQFQFREGQLALMDSFAAANKFVNDTKPWELVKTDLVASQKILGILGWYLVTAAYTMEPYLPFTSATLLDTLVSPESKKNNTINSIQDKVNWDYLTIVDKPDYLFIKITDEQIEEEMNKLNATVA
jgi:methionyl-tRNA synthetase